MALLFIPGYMADEELWLSLEAELDEFRSIVHADIGNDGSIADMARRSVAEAPSTLSYSASPSRDVWRARSQAWPSTEWKRSYSLRRPHVPTRQTKPEERVRQSNWRPVPSGDLAERRYRRLCILPVDPTTN